MNNKDKSSNFPPNNVLEHPQLKRDRAFALFLARAHAYRNGKPPPNPDDIGPAAFTKLTPDMSREERRAKLLETLKRIGLKPNGSK
ncbi:MAG: hypothetical protein HOI46_07220 [Rhodospirillaceae bacterium]|jgi:hypothetical protein|nr:hypothetical protein [Rhodospirillaceae bacterium]